MPKKRLLREEFRQPAAWQWGRFTNARGKALRYGGSVPQDPVAHIVFVEGLSDFAERNFELARDFNKHSVGFWTFDRQGQGLSGRFLKNKFKQYSEGFDHDARDVEQFVRDVVPKDGKPIILFGHSTGGMIALLALHDSPELFDGSVLTSPLLGMLNPAAKDKEKFWAKTPMPRSIRHRYVPGGNDSWMRKSPRRLHGQESYTSDPERMKVPDYWTRLCKGLRTGSPTFGWAKAACETIIKIREPGYLKDIHTPMLVFSAGQDVLVNNRHLRKAIDDLPHATHVNFRKGKHDLTLEVDPIRNKIIDDTLKFIRSLPKPQ